MVQFLYVYLKVNPLLQRFNKRSDSMFEELNEQLARVKELQQKRQQWKHQRANYQLEIEEKQQTKVDLEEKIEAYRAEREKLDKITFVHLKAILTGSKDEKIYEKRNQITDAQYDYDE